MGKFIPKLISILMPTKNKERHDFTTKVKNEVVRKQKGKCAICGGRMNRWNETFTTKMVTNLKQQSLKLSSSSYEMPPKKTCKRSEQ